MARLQGYWERAAVNSKTKDARSIAEPEVTVFFGRVCTAYACHFQYPRDSRGCPLFPMVSFWVQIIQSL